MNVWFLVCGIIQESAICKIDYIFVVIVLFPTFGGGPSLCVVFDLENDRGELIPHVLLSVRERQILSLVVRGRVTKDIADILGIHPRTVCSYLQRLSLGLECHGRQSLVRWALCYPQVLDGTAAPKLPHAEGCLCSGAYCQAVIHRIG